MDAGGRRVSALPEAAIGVCSDTVAAAQQRRCGGGPGNATESRAAGSYLRIRTSSEVSELPTCIATCSVRMYFLECITSFSDNKTECPLSPIHHSPFPGAVGIAAAGVQLQLFV